MGPAATKSGTGGAGELKSNEWVKKGGYADTEKIFLRVLSQSAYESESVPPVLQPSS